MGLKFIGIFLLLVAAVYAAPSTEVEENEDPIEMEDTEALDAMEDDDDLAEDFGLEEEDPRRKSPYRPYFSQGKYCVCKNNRGKGDEAEVTEEDVSDHIDTVADRVDAALADPRRRKPKKKNWHKALKKLVGPFFRPENLGCFCTRNKAVVRLLNYLHIAHIIHLRQKTRFIKHVKVLVEQVKKQRRG